MHQGRGGARRRGRSSRLAFDAFAGGVPRAACDGERRVAVGWCKVSGKARGGRGALGGVQRRRQRLGVVWGGPRGPGRPCPPRRARGAWTARPARGSSSGFVVRSRRHGQRDGVDGEAVPSLRGSFPCHRLKVRGHTSLERARARPTPRPWTRAEGSCWSARPAAKVKKKKVRKKSRQEKIIFILGHATTW